jgi:hypothetical protein
VALCFGAVRACACQRRRVRAVARAYAWRARRCGGAARARSGVDSAARPQAAPAASPPSSLARTAPCALLRLRRGACSLLAPLATPSPAGAHAHPFTCAARTAPSAPRSLRLPRSARAFYRRLRARRAACRAVCTPDPHSAALAALAPVRRPGMRAGGGAYAPRRRRDAAAALSAWWAVALFACRWRGAAAKIDTTTETEVFLQTLEDPLAICNDGSPGAPPGWDRCGARCSSPLLVRRSWGLCCALRCNAR